MKRLVLRLMFILFVVSLVSCTDNTEELVINNQLETRLTTPDVQTDGVLLTDPDDDGTDDDEVRETGL